MIWEHFAVPKSKVLKDQKMTSMGRGGMDMSKGHRSQLKEFPMDKAELIWPKTKY